MKVYNLNKNNQSGDIIVIQNNLQIYKINLPNRLCFGYLQQILSSGLCHWLIYKKYSFIILVFLMDFLILRILNMILIQV